MENDSSSVVPCKFLGAALIPAERSHSLDTVNKIAEKIYKAPVKFPIFLQIASHELKGLFFVLFIAGMLSLYSLLTSDINTLQPFHARRAKRSTFLKALQRKLLFSISISSALAFARARSKSSRF
jgi:hypothetical protein